MSRVKHGHASRARNGRQTRFTPEYRAWAEMIKRCEKPQAAHYDRYGGRGIRVAKCWRHDFAAFLREIGLRPTTKHSVDRIDNARGYEPGNVRWATQVEQARNRSSTRLITFRGETRCISEWAASAGLNLQTFWYRVRAGWSMERALRPARRGNYSKQGAR